MARQSSESGGSFSANELVTFSESHDVHDMRPQVDSDDPNGPRAPLRSNFDDPDGWEPTESPGHHFSFPTSVVGQTGEVHRMDPVACRPIIKCCETGCAVSCTPSEVVQGYQAGMETVTCKLCETTFPRSNVILSDFDSCQNACLAISRRPSWVSWSDLPRVQSAPSGEDTATQECAQSHQFENARGPQKETLGQGENSLTGSRFSALCSQRVEVSRCARHVLCR